MNPNDFDPPLMYKALAYMVRANSGNGFHNQDQGHPCYQAGAEGREYSAPGPKDGPDKNELYKMMVSLSREWGTSEPNYPSIKNWQDFCKLAYEAYLRAKGERHRGMVD